MSITCEFRGPVLIVTLPTRHVFSELQEAVDRAIGSSDFRPGSTLLFDARLSSINPNSDEVRQRASWIAGLRGRGLSDRCAFVCRSEPLRFALGRMTSIMLDNLGIEMEVFTGMEEAFAWLG
jgi:hypothetical protein